MRGCVTVYTSQVSFPNSNFLLIPLIVANLDDRQDYISGIVSSYLAKMLLSSSCPLRPSVESFGKLKSLSTRPLIIESRPPLLQWHFDFLERTPYDLRSVF